MANSAAFDTASAAGWSGQFSVAEKGPLADALASSNDNLAANPFSSAAGLLPGGATTTEPWNFTVSPEDISWTTNAQVDRVSIFGTNAPPVTSGTIGMRDLTLSNCLLEGFSRGVQVEDQVTALENLMSYTLNSDKGFVNIPVYHIRANNKNYGNGNSNDGGFFVIKDIKVKESMRDLSGSSTRANVDVSFVQVPAYQVDSGRDQASQAVAGSKAAFPEQQADQGVGTTKPSGGPNSVSTTTTKNGKTTTRVVTKGTDGTTTTVLKDSKGREISRTVRKTS